jgi:hypothetical protein
MGPNDLTLPLPKMRIPGRVDNSTRALLWSAETFGLPSQTTAARLRGLAERRMSPSGLLRGNKGKGQWLRDLAWGATSGNKDVAKAPRALWAAAHPHQSR